MKKQIFLLTVLTIFAFTANATIWTVSNNPDSPGQFTSLQAAIDTSIVNDGDTLYITGSLTNYGSIILNRSLTLIGTGHHPQKDMAFVSFIEFIYLQEQTDPYGTVINNADNVTLTGLGIRVIKDNYGAQNIAVSHCRIISSMYEPAIWMENGCNNWTISNNYIYADYECICLNYAVNVIISNNVFGNWGGIVHEIITNSNNSSVIITNNLFLQWNNAPRVFAKVSFAIITNNIFYGINPDGSDNCAFNNNIAVSYDLPYGSNTGINNMNLQDPLFVDVPPADYKFSWDYDYHLSEASPGHNAGTDGTDIGPFGGKNPLSVTGEPSIPVVMEMNIINPTLPENGTLEIQMKARIQN